MNILEAIHRKEIDGLLEDLDSSEGIYYYVQLPTGWEVIPLRFADEGDCEHADWWPELCKEIALRWTVTGTKTRRATAAKKAEQLAKQLEPCWRGFPRGRISCAVADWSVLYGGDQEVSKIGGIASIKMRVTRSFGLTHPAWVVDDHEQCLVEHRDRLCKLLNIEPAWKAS